MKQKIKRSFKKPLVKIIFFIAIILGAILTILIKEMDFNFGSIVMFSLVAIFILTGTLFFYKEKSIKELIEIINKRYPLFGKILLVLFKIIIFLILLSSILIILLGILSSVSQKIKEENNNLPQKEEEKQEVALTTEEVIVKDNIQWKISDVKESQFYSGDYTSGKFVEVYIEAKNLSDPEREIFFSKELIKLLDDQNRKFSILQNNDNDLDSLLIREGFMPNMVLKPDIPEVYRFVFETPRNSTGFSLNINYR